MKTNSSGKHIAVLGAGIIGICCALSLQEKGYTVTIIDRIEPGQATSYGNAGVISPWSCVPQCLPGIWKQIPNWLMDPKGPVKVRLRDLPKTIPWALKFLLNTRPEKVKEISNSMEMLMRDNVSSYRRLLKGTGHEALLKDSLMVNVFRGNNVPNLEDFAWKLRTEQGAPAEIVDKKTLKEIEPFISEDYHSAIIVKDQARAVAPGEICRILAEKAFNNGAQFLQRSITGITVSQSGNYILSSEADTLEVEKLVVCGGIWSAGLLNQIGVKLPLIAERGYHLEFVDPEISVNNSIMDVAGKFIASSMVNGVRAAGTAEFASVDAPPNYKRAQILKPLAKRLFPDLNTNNTKQWMGIRPSFPDNLPVVGQLDGFNGLFLAFGHSHYGLGMAPATGRIIADQVTGAVRNDDLSSISANRYLT